MAWQRASLLRPPIHPFSTPFAVGRTALQLSVRRYAHHDRTANLPPVRSVKPLWRIVALGAFSLSIAGFGVTLYERHERSPSEAELKDLGPLAHLPWSALLRRYGVYVCCSSTTLMDWSPALIDWSQRTSIPGVKKAMDWVMINTFFAQFVGGETTDECKKVVLEAAKYSIGSILAYSAEVDLHSALHVKDVKSAQTLTSSHSLDDPSRYLFTDKVDEYMHSIRAAAECNEANDAQSSDQAASFPSRNGSIMIAVKLSGLLQDANVLERASAAIVPRESFSDPPATLPPLDAIVAKGACPGLMIPVSALEEKDVFALKALWETLQRLAQCAEQHGRVKILIDAEYSWYQPAIDALFESCARQYNRLPTKQKRSSVWLWRNSGAADTTEQSGTPIVYNTYQAYLRRTPAYLAMSMERARVGRYSLGVKLVRGAYVEVENALWKDTIVPTPPGMDDDALEAFQGDQKGRWKSPVWPSKALTDECYDMCAQILVDRVAQNVLDPAADAVQLGVVFAGHNWNSAMTVIDQMIKTGLAVQQDTPPKKDYDELIPFRNLRLVSGVRGRLFLGQLYGMADDLTFAIQCAFDPTSGGDGPHLALKYIPYGNLALVMPYLTRRAQENKSVMGGGRATRERSAITSEVYRRLRSVFSL